MSPGPLGDLTRWPMIIDAATMALAASVIRDCPMIIGWHCDRLSEAPRLNLGRVRSASSLRQLA
eukprot:761583-Hanusia_phi.AAC.6